MADTEHHGSEIYAPINVWQTRLLKLHAGSRNDPLSGDLVVADVVELDGLVIHNAQVLTTYEAISYTWGEPKYPHRIQLNGIPFAITQNLKDALQHFRHPKRARYLWVDAICIDQSNDSEKSMQVRRLFSIFCKAETVLAWLGPASENTNVAIEYLRKLHSGERSVESPEVVSGLHNLFDRPWIRRAWVQQEVYAAKQVVIQCGDQQMSLDQFRSLSKNLETHLLTSAYRELLKRRLGRNLRVAGALGRGEKITWDEPWLMNHGCICHSPHFRPHSGARPECVLRIARDLEATDPRDRVYALLGMTDCRISVTNAVEAQGSVSRESGDDGVLRIDYSLSPSRVYQDLARYIINRDGHLNILKSHTPAASPTQNDLSLPSWCPDWRYLPDHFEWRRSEYDDDHTEDSSSKCITWRENAGNLIMRMTGVAVAVKSRARKRVYFEERDEFEEFSEFEKSDEIRQQEHLSYLRSAAGPNEERRFAAKLASWWTADIDMEDIDMEVTDDDRGIRHVSLSRRQLEQCRPGDMIVQPHCGRMVVILRPRPTAEGFNFVAALARATSNFPRNNSDFTYKYVRGQDKIYEVY